MSSFDSHPRTLLFVSVSVIALLAASPEVRGADLPRAPMFAKAPVAVPTDRLAVWVEGGAFSTGGSDVWFGDPTDVGRVKWGREGAVGFDYRFAVTQWHVSAQFRYGSAAANAEAFSRRGTFLVSGSSTTKKFPVLGTGSFSSSRNALAGRFCRRPRHRARRRSDAVEIRRAHRRPSSQDHRRRVRRCAAHPPLPWSGRREDVFA